MRSFERIHILNLKERVSAMLLNKHDFPPEKHALICAINIIGCPAEVAKQLGIARQNVDHWLYHRKIAPPERHCDQIEKATKGVVTKEELRPDIFKGIPSKKPTFKQTRKEDIEKAKAHIAAALNYINDL